VVICAWQALPRVREFCVGRLLDRDAHRTSGAAMIFDAASRSFALRSTIFASAISRTWACVSLPTFVVCGTPEPFATPAAFLMSSAAGGVLRMNVNERSS